jgi:hypothetical protein
MVIVVTFTGIGTSGLPELAAATLVAGFAATIGFGLVGEGASGADAAASADFSGGCVAGSDGLVAASASERSSHRHHRPDE